MLDYTPFPGSVCGAVCPNLCMDECTRKDIDFAAQIGNLGKLSADIKVGQPAAKNGRKVGIIGGGAAGLTAAWQLVRQGYDVTVFEADAKMGGKMEQVIPRSRLSQEVLKRELKRIESLGVRFQTNTKVDAKQFAKIRSSHDAVIVATGGHTAKVISWPGSERLVKGIDFLKAVNRGEQPTVGKKVIVIGCGNSGMDAAVGAYQMGAEEVVCIDVQKPAAFEQEIAHVEELGGKLMWPVFTKEITAEGIVTQDGELIKGDTVIISVGEMPELSFLPADVKIERGFLSPEADYCIADGVFTAGDTVKPGRLVDAIGAGRQAALSLDAYLSGKQYVSEEKPKVPASKLATAYFKKCHSCETPKAAEDYTRCISCGTCRDCHMCYQSCPEKAISRTALPNGAFEYVSDPEKCIGCGICSGVCPCGVWTMKGNSQALS